MIIFLIQLFNWISSRSSSTYKPWLSWTDQFHKKSNGTIINPSCLQPSRSISTYKPWLSWTDQFHKNSNGTIINPSCLQPRCPMSNIPRLWYRRVCPEQSPSVANRSVCQRRWPFLTDMTVQNSHRRERSPHAWLSRTVTDVKRLINVCFNFT